MTEIPEHLRRRAAAAMAKAEADAAEVPPRVAAFDVTAGGKPFDIDALLRTFLPDLGHEEAVLRAAIRDADLAVTAAVIVVMYRRDEAAAARSRYYDFLAAKVRGTVPTTGDESTP